MSAVPAYRFRPVRARDHAMLVRWRSFEHVHCWWGDPDPAEDSADARVARWIVSLRDRPFAYLQDYDVHGWPDHPFRHLPPGARGIDLFIGPPEMLGRGHGTGFIRQRLAGLFREGAPAVCVDPHPDNARAIAVYERAGFRVVGPPRDTRWGRMLPMEAWR